MMTRKRIIRIIVEHVVFDLIIAGIVSFIVSFPIMLTLGALHIEWPQIPAFGWWTVYLLVAAWLVSLNTTRLMLSDNFPTLNKGAQ